VQFAAVRGLDIRTGGLLPFIPPTRARVELRSFLPDLDVAKAATGVALTKPQLAAGVTANAFQERFDATTDFVTPADANTVWHADASGELVGLPLPLWLSVEVRNLTNERYRDQLSLLRYFADQPGREVWLRATSRFDAPF